MSYLNHLLARFGVGAANVDTQLNSAILQVGGMVDGVVVISGGKVDQTVDRIYMFLMTQHTRTIANAQKVVEKFEIEIYHITDFTLAKANDIKRVPFTFKLPYYTPISVANTNVWFKTGLDIKTAVDPIDNDYVNIVPPKQVELFFKAMERLGLYLEQALCRTSHPKQSIKTPIVQIFEFIPTRDYREKIEKVKMFFEFVDNTYRFVIILDLDKLSEGITGFVEETLNKDLKTVIYTLGNTETPTPAAISQVLSELINSQLS